jgi:hypothetical protein
LGIQIEGAFEIIPVQKFNEPDVLRNAVIIAECNGFAFVLVFKIHRLFLHEVFYVTA